jgi:hypothetical protein
MQDRINTSAEGARMSNASQVSADRIGAAVVEALQAADEIGGPERPEYVRLMDRLAQLCAMRAATARANAPEQEVLRWAQRNIHKGAFIEHTGGGCTALQIPVHGCPRGDWWWLTDELSAPETVYAKPGDQPFCLCLYHGEGEGQIWVGFNVTSLYDARTIIRAHTGAQWSE